MKEQELLKQKLHYDPNTGIFTALHSHGTRVKGEPVGYLNPAGYLIASFNGQSYALQRLAFLYMTGDWPVGEVDHKDTDRVNNKWSNLRDVSKSVNLRNRLRFKNNKSGTTGVSWSTREKRWCATILSEGKRVFLGYFDYKEDAVLVRMTAEKKYGYWVDKVHDMDDVLA